MGKIGTWQQVGGDSSATVAAMRYKGDKAKLFDTSLYAACGLLQSPQEIKNGNT